MIFDNTTAAKALRRLLGLIALLTLPFVFIGDLIAGLPGLPDVTVGWIGMSMWLLLVDFFHKFKDPLNVDKPIEKKENDNLFGYDPEEDMQEPSKSLDLVPYEPIVSQRHKSSRRANTGNRVSKTMCRRSSK